MFDLFDCNSRIRKYPYASVITIQRSNIVLIGLNHRRTFWARVKLLQKTIITVKQ